MTTDTCIFCRILAHQAPASFVYQDDLTAAFMDLSQPNPYKVLVVTHAHVENIFDLQPEQAGALMQTAARVAQAIRAASHCEGMSVFQSNGRAAGQDVFHIHIHLIPRFTGDRLAAGVERFVRNLRQPMPPRAELDQLAADLRALLE